MKTLYTLALSLLMILALASCNSTKSTIMNIDDLTGSYTIKTLNNKEVKTVVPKFSLNGADNAINGNTGCNSFFGSFDIEKNHIQLSQMGVSEMYCEENGVMELERTFLDALHNAKSFELKDNILIFYSETGIKVLEAARGITR